MLDQPTNPNSQQPIQPSVPVVPSVPDPVPTPQTPQPAPVPPVQSPQNNPSQPTPSVPKTVEPVAKGSIAHSDSTNQPNPPALPPPSLSQGGVVVTSQGAKHTNTSMIFAGVILLILVAGGGVIGYSVLVNKQTTSESVGAVSPVPGRTIPTRAPSAPAVTRPSPQQEVVAPQASPTATLLPTLSSGAKDNDDITVIKNELDATGVDDLSQDLSANDQDIAGL